VCKDSNRDPSSPQTVRLDQPVMVGYATDNADRRLSLIRDDGRWKLTNLLLDENLQKKCFRLPPFTFSGFQLACNFFSNRLHLFCPYPSFRHINNWWRHKLGHAQNMLYQQAILLCFFCTRIWRIIKLYSLVLIRFNAIIWQWISFRATLLYCSSVLLHGCEKFD